MNVFILDKDLQKSAQLLADQHLGKQILEIAQILCTVQAMRGYKTPYKPTHKNHPVTKWATVSDNFQFCLMYNWLHLGKEFEYRFGKKHKSSNILINYYDEFQTSLTITDFPIRNDLEYYKEKLKGWLEREKPLLATWTRRETPEWYNEMRGIK